MSNQQQRVATLEKQEADQLAFRQDLADLANRILDNPSLVSPENYARVVELVEIARQRRELHKYGWAEGRAVDPQQPAGNLEEQRQAYQRDLADLVNRVLENPSLVDPEAYKRTLELVAVARQSKYLQLHAGPKGA